MELHQGINHQSTTKVPIIVRLTWTKKSLDCLRNITRTASFTKFLTVSLTNRFLTCQGVYSINGRRLICKMVNDLITVRMGGGYMPLSEYLKLYSPEDDDNEHP